MSTNPGAHVGAGRSRAFASDDGSASATRGRELRRQLRWVTLAGLIGLSAVVAVAGTFVHAATARAGTVPIPYGLVLALLGLAAVLLLSHKTARGRLGVVPVATAWLLPVWLFTQERPAGDVVIANGWAGLTYLFTGVVLIGVSVGLPQR